MSGGTRPETKALIFLITLSPIAILLSAVAELICGNKITLSDSSNLVVICGSCSNTSSPAPPIFFW